VSAARSSHALRLEVTLLANERRLAVIREGLEEEAQLLPTAIDTERLESGSKTMNSTMINPNKPGSRPACRPMAGGNTSLRKLKATGNTEINIAPNTAPNMLPRPPTTIMSNSFKDSSTLNTSGAR
jgi:hypothetical protein